MLEPAVVGGPIQLVFSLGAVLFCGWLGHRVFKKGRTGAIAGAVFGLLLVSQGPLRRAFEGAPPQRPELIVEVPADFTHETVIIIADPKVETEVSWNEKTNKGHIKAPRSGIIRLKDLGRLDNQLTYCRLSNGKTNTGLLNSNIHGARIVAYRFTYTLGSEPDLGLLNDNELADLVRKREAE